MDKTVIIEGNIIKHGHRIISFKSLYTNEFCEYLNAVVKKFNFGTVIDNVVYLYFIKPMLTFAFYFKINEIEYVEIKKTSRSDKQIIASAAFYLGISCNIKTKKFSMAGRLYNRVFIWLAALYLLFVSLLEQYLPSEKCNDCDVWIIRDDAEKQKIYARDKTIILEETQIGRGSLYQNILMRNRWINILKSYRRAKQEYCLVRSVLNENELSGLNILVLPYFARRLTHIFYWGYSLETLIESGVVGRAVITGNFCDAYAEVEKRVSRKHKKALIVLPHGVEDGIAFPNGYAGDMFYSMTEYACNYLNRLYQTEKFVYDGTVISNMLRKKAINQTRRFVFFTDGTGSGLDIELIIHLSKFLRQYKKNLYIKLHPHEKNLKYKNIANIDFIWKLDEALCGNVCIARGSTVLVEAIYNDSIPVRVVIGDDELAYLDRIPSLEDKRIAHVASYEDLDVLIINELMKERTK